MSARERSGWTPDTPDFSPEAIAEAALLDETRAWFDVHRAHFVPEIQIRFMSLLTAGESLLAALEASERERDKWQIRAEVAEEIAADAVLREQAEKARAIGMVAAPISKAVAGSMRREMDSVADERDAALAALEASERERERLRWFERIARETEERAQRLEAEIDSTQRAYDRGWAAGWAARSDEADEAEQ